MNRFQKLSFKRIEDLLEFLPENELKIVEALRKIVLNNIPNVTEKLAYNVPYYYLNSRVCFIWPGSVPWGGTRGGVQFGFCRGALLRDESQFLKGQDLKEVRSLTYHQLSDIDSELLISFLFEAVEIDEREKKGKRG